MKLSIILPALAVLLTVSARAGEIKKIKPSAGHAGKAAAKIAVSTRTAGGKELHPAEESGGAGLKNAAISGLKEWDSKLETLRTRFSQEVDFFDAGLKQHIEGVLSYMKPDLLKIEHIKPARQLVYTDKKELWVYKPEDSQAVRTSWAAWKKNQSGNFSGIMDFGNYAALTEKNNVSVVRNAAAPYYLTMTLTPKNEPGLYTLELALSSTDYFPAEASLTVDKTVIRTRLENPEKNAALDKALFRFVPPKGTEVLEFKN
ncbi:MAG: outer membrane lipoprotein carrier protein LolA [Elusimicrobiales bacterium]|jgi:chaperone LolA